MSLHVKRNYSRQAPAHPVHQVHQANPVQFVQPVQPLVPQAQLNNTGIVVSPMTAGAPPSQSGNSGTSMNNFTLVLAVFCLALLFVVSYFLYNKNKHH